MSQTVPYTIGLLLFPRLTQLDLTGPYEVFARAPGATVHLIWKTREPVVTAHGLTITPTAAFADCPPLDLLCVPGGPGQVDLMDDPETLAFLQNQARGAKWVTSVCTGSLLLGAAGLLRGYRATSHWSAVDQLTLLGATPVHERVVWDRNRVTAAGVTSGIDFALRLVATIYGQATAEAIELQMEYDPDPPFHTGSITKAPVETLTQARQRISKSAAQRLAVTTRAAQRLNAKQ